MSSEKTLFTRLRRLFNNNVIVRRVGKDQLKVLDNDHLQSLGNFHNSKYIDRFTRLHGVRPHTLNSYQPNYNYFSQKTELYTEYEVMDQDSIISAALDIYAEETVLKDDFGDVLQIKSENENIKKILHNLFYDVLNIDFNLWPWVRNMVKYGDFYLKLDIADEIGIINVTPLSAYDIIREEGTDPNNPYAVRFRLTAGGKVTYENFEVAHFRLLSDSNFLPYGKSMLEGARKVWKQLTLMEDAMLIHRIMRAPEKRIFKVDVGNIPPQEIDNYMQKIINQMRKTPHIDPNTGQYNLKFNMQNMLEDYFLPVRGGQSGTEIDTLSGMEFTGIEDIEYLKNRMMAALKVPKAFLGYDEALSGKASLAAEDVRFARTIERIQRIVISELHKIAIVHLYSQGFRNAELIDFSLNMTSPSTIYEQEKVTLYTSKVDLAGSMIDKKLFSKEWIYKNIFNFTDDQILDINEKVIEDQKESFRMTKISEEGEDPANPPGGGEKGGEGGEEENPFAAGAEGEEEGGEEAGGEEAGGEEKGAEEKGGGEEAEKTKNPFESVNKGGAPKGGWPGAGRPKEPMKYNSHKHPRGYDPIGKISLKHARPRPGNTRESISNELLFKYGLKNRKPKSILTEKDNLSIMDERNIIE